MPSCNDPPTPADGVAPFDCPHFPACPGCPWIQRPYAQQLAAKQQRVVTALAAALPECPPGLVAPVTPAPDTSGYRVQTKLMVGAPARGLVLGLYAPGSHRILDVSGCPLHDRLLQHAIPVIRDGLRAEGIAIHGRGRPGVRYVLARASLAEARVLLTLVSSRVPLPNVERLARRLRSAMPLAGLLVNENTTTGNVILGERTERVWGEAVLRERYGSVTIAAGPTAFVQANTRMATVIYGAIADAAGLTPGTRALDLYCGVGGIALSLAARGAAVVGVEEVAAAVAAASANAERAGSRDVRFVAARVEDALAEADDARVEVDDQLAKRDDPLAKLDTAVDVVTMNPPRKGCGPSVVAALIRSAVPRLLYLSCNPESFARDAAALVAGGFALDHVRPFDLLPQTDHVELLGAFRRRGGA